MYCMVITILLSVVSFTFGTYLPSVYWDPTNPILKQQYWHEVVQVKIFDIITFICPNDIIKMTGTETTNHMDGLYQNLYVKEIPADIKTFDGICDTKENSTFIKNCVKPKELDHQNIDINLQSADPSLPTFKYDRDYMFFATSDGTRKSLNTTSKNCTMVFRIHFNKAAEQTPFPSCPLLGRDKVCEPPTKKKVREPPTKKKECKDIIPKGLNVTKTTANSANLTWQPPTKPPCNITYYTMCCRERLAQQCKEVLVSGEQHTATLCQLKSEQEYVAKVRIHTAEGPGNYSDEITFKTETTVKADEPTALPQKEEQSTSVDGKSIAIGFVVGFLLAMILLIALWVFISRFYKKKDNTVEDEPGTNQNNPKFCKEDEPMNDVLKLNTGYRQSGQNWRLPPVTEENLHLYVSDA